MYSKKRKFQKLLNLKVWKNKDSKNKFNLCKDLFKDYKEKNNFSRKRQKHKILSFLKSNNFKFNCKTHLNKIK